MKKLMALLSLVLLWVAPARAEDAALTRLWITRGGDAVPVTYELLLQDGEYRLRENDGPPLPIDADAVGQIRRIIGDFDMMSWDGFCESDPNVLDGEDFALEMEFADGTAVRASGSNAFPDGYFGAMGGIEAVLERERMARIAGDYRYEGEGLGGDFTITLNADGSYAFSEGPLSGYAGGGEWYAYMGEIVLNETNGLELCNVFFCDADALVFCEAGSDGFSQVRVPDEGRFVRVAAPEQDDRDAPAQTAPTLAISANGSTFHAQLEDNSSAAALVERLSAGGIEVEMSDYGGFEKVGALPWSLPRNDETVTTRPGDVILYQGDRITIYYDQNTWDFTRLARIADATREELLAALGEGDVTVRFQVEWNR